MLRSPHGLKFRISHLGCFDKKFGAQGEVIQFMLQRQAL
jgi:hypothetical protein